MDIMKKLFGNKKAVAPKKEEKVNAKSAFVQIGKEKVLVSDLLALRNALMNAEEEEVAKKTEEMSKINTEDSIMVNGEEVAVQDLVNAYNEMKKQNAEKEEKENKEEEAPEEKEAAKDGEELEKEHLEKDEKVHAKEEVKEDEKPEETLDKDKGKANKKDIKFFKKLNSLRDEATVENSKGAEPDTLVRRVNRGQERYGSVKK